MTTHDTRSQLLAEIAARAVADFLARRRAGSPGA